MDKFDTSRLSVLDYTLLRQAVSVVSPRERLWYLLPSATKSYVNKNEIAKNVFPISDYQKFKEAGVSPSKIPGSKAAIEVFRAKGRGFHLENLIGLGDIDICVYNPLFTLPELKIGKKTARLVQIDGLNFGNVHESEVNFEDGIAILREEDQDLAHKLGFEYTPVGVPERYATKPSDFEMHRNKPKNEEEPILYCDNRACQSKLRSPRLIVDPQTGGLYHSRICFGKDMGLKGYLAREIPGIDLVPNPIKITWEHAAELYKTGKLLQSPNPISRIQLRSLSLWPEAAAALHH